jgi:hypothetical protein
MRKVYKTLTQDQKSRGVIFSSQLRPGTTIHEVKYNDRDRDATIDRLLDDKFFNNSPYTRSEIRR